MSESAVRESWIVIIHRVLKEEYKRDIASKGRPIERILRGKHDNKTFLYDKYVKDPEIHAITIIVFPCTGG